MATESLNGEARSEQLRRMENIIANITSMRRDAFRGMFDPRRDVETECGYPRLTDRIEPEEYARMWDRDPIAARVVEVLPKECWQVMPQIYESEEGEEPTAFELSLKALASTLRGDYCYHDAEDGSAVLGEYWLRADILSGIGRNGIILLGLDDGKDLREPAMPRPGQKCLFLRTFPEHQAQITRYENDVRNRRFGQPVTYNITLNDPREDVQGIGLSIQTSEVHWSRVVHLADVSHQASSSEVMAPPRMRCVWNNILGCHKILAADPEAYWKNCLMKFFLETHPELGGDVDVDREGLRAEVEPFINGLEQFFALSGMTAKPIAPVVVDPTPHIAAQVKAICIKLGMPVPVFEGYEIGEQASENNDNAWFKRLRFRQGLYCTPRIIVPTLDRLIYLGVLAPPVSAVGNVKIAQTTIERGKRVQVVNAMPLKRGFSVYWPDLTSASDHDKATVMLARTQAYAAYVGGNVQSIMSPFKFMTVVDSMDPAEAEDVVADAMGEIGDDGTAEIEEPVTPDVVQPETQPEEAAQETTT